jgi:hypothetical protein
MLRMCDDDALANMFGFQVAALDFQSNQTCTDTVRRSSPQSNIWRWIVDFISLLSSAATAAQSFTDNSK